MHVDADHIRELIEQAGVQTRGKSVSLAASEHLERTFPFPKFDSTRIIDWNVVPHVELDWMSASNDETSLWAASTLAGSCSTGLLLYSPHEPCVIGPFDFMIRNLDRLVWRASGPVLLFGVEKPSPDEVRFTHGVIEFNGRGTLFASV